jgi:uncharacterized membrane protein
MLTGFVFFMMGTSSDLFVFHKMQGISLIADRTVDFIILLMQDDFCSYNVRRFQNTFCHN